MDQQEDLHKLLVAHNDEQKCETSSGDSSDREPIHANEGFEGVRDNHEEEEEVFYPLVHKTNVIPAADCLDLAKIFEEGKPFTKEENSRASYEIKDKATPGKMNTDCEDGIKLRLIRESRLETDSLPKSKTAPQQKMLPTNHEDRVKLKLLLAAEDKVDRETDERCKAIVKAIYFDREQELSNLIMEGVPLSNREIQRRILEAVELDSLKCLDVLCKAYENNPISAASDIKLFHRRYGLSFWPLQKRPRVTALHVLANKLRSKEFMAVLERRSKFLNDFSDVPDSHGSTPLLLAIKCYNVEVAKRLLLIKPTPDLRKKNYYDESPIRVVALNDHVDILRHIIRTYSECKKSSELHEAMKNVDKDGHTILYPASRSGKPEVLKLVMKQACWKEFLEEEKKFLEEEKKKEDWLLFAGYVCASGATSLAKMILEEKCQEKCDGKCVHALMRAAEAGQKEIVNLIVEMKRDHDLFTTSDDCGRNVFHYAVKHPDVLGDLLRHYLKLKTDNDDDSDAVSKMDDGKNSPMRLAAILGYDKSFDMLSDWSSENRLAVFSNNLIHSVDIKILKKKFLELKKSESSVEVARLLTGEHEEHQPFLEAALKGNVELMEFFLQQGANHMQRNSDNQTALHCAVRSGKLKAVEYLLTTRKNMFLKMIDFTDDVNVSAAGYATQIGFSRILRCLLEHKAKMKSDKKTGRLNIMDSAYDCFKTGEKSVKEIIEFCTKDKKIKILRELFEDSCFGADCLMSKLIEETPNIAMMIFNLCVYEDKYFTHRSYGETMVGGRVSYSFFPFKKGKDLKGNLRSDGKLEAIESMVKFKRDDCLGHPVVIRFLNEKMNSSGIQNWVILNILLYMTFLFTLTAYSGIQSQGKEKPV